MFNFPNFIITLFLVITLSGCYIRQKGLHEAEEYRKMGFVANANYLKHKAMTENDYYVIGLSDGSENEKDIHSFQLNMPLGYRKPIGSDLKTNWKEYIENNHKTPYHIIADFNGDKIRDEAWILLKSTSTGWGLFVFLGQKDKDTKTICLDENSDDTYYRMGIAIVKPGSYKTVAGKGYLNPAENGPDEINIKYQSIDYYLFESSNSCYYWDDRTQGFKRVWISD